MEAAAGRGGSLPVSSSSSQTPPRKEWRAVAEHPYRTNGSEETEHGKLGESDERTIYEEGRGPLEVDFCSITIDGAGGLNDDILQQRLQSVVRQREELQHMEIELRAQAIARSEILEVQHRFEAQIKDQAASAAKLKEQLQDQEKHILELEMKLEEKERELRAVKMDNEAAWAKEDLLREQNKELATFRRERDNSEAERAQHLKQIHDLQDHIHEKENQFLALEEQHRVAQETILYKDEQLREAQAWLSRAQEMDALHSTTNQTLQAELRERTEQFNQYWINFQRQFAEMERHHLQAIQQLQLELAEARERNGRYKDDSRAACENSDESSSRVQIKGNKNNVNDSGMGNADLGIIANGNVDGASSFIAASSASTMVLPPSLLGIGAFLPPGQMPAVHPYMMHPQGLPHSVASTNSLVPQSQLGHVQPLTTIPDQQHLQNQQAVSDVSHIPNQTKQQPPQTDQNVIRSDAAYNYQLSAERLVVHADHLSAHVNQQQRSDHTVSRSSEEVQGKQKKVTEESEKILDANSQYSSTLNLDPLEKKSEPKAENESIVAVPNQPQDSVIGQQCSASSVVLTVQNSPLSSNCASESNKNVGNYAEVPTSAGRTSRSLLPGKVEPVLLDERALLACIVRAIPSGSDGRIRISSTLPNRLGKMLSPLHWHDYKKHYGKLDDFVACHPELFVIEGDFIHLREGAQHIISATTAVAKVAAAAAAASPAPYPALLPSVAVTPVAQSIHQKKATAVDSRSMNPMASANSAAVSDPGDLYDKHPQIQKMHDQQHNGSNINIIKRLADVQVSSTLKDIQESNGLLTEKRPGQASVYVAAGNGRDADRASLVPHNKGMGNGRHGYGSKQPGRSSAAGLISKR